LLHNFYDFELVITEITHIHNINIHISEVGTIYGRN
jgi:hypothetical protein